MNPRTPRALLIVAALAVLVGFAGSATAGVVVTGKQIKDGTITTADLKDESLTGSDVRDGSLTQSDFFDVLAGPAGPQGDPGPEGRPGTSGLVYRLVGNSIPKNSDLMWPVVCPPGTTVISGGGSSTGRGELTASAPRDRAGTGWFVAYRNPTGAAITAYAWALCVTAS
jgi:hypothetical protein